MAKFSDFSELSDRERAELEQSVNLFSLACETSAPKVLLDDFLPRPNSSLRVPTLWRLIPKDMSRRRKLGEEVRLETYLSQYPELGGRDQIPRSLWEEFESESPQVAEPSPRGSNNSVSFEGTLLPPETSLAPAESRKASHIRPATVSQSTSQSAPYTIPGRETDYHDMGAEGTGRPLVSTNGEFPPQSVGAGRYRLIRPLGQGQYGTVWEAEAPGGVRVAVKMIRFPLGHRISNQELTSLELIKQLRHPLLLEVQSFWEEGDHLIIVTSLAEKTLEDRLEECQTQGLPGIPADELLEYMRDAADAIDYLHNKDVIHRDIKPANILLFAKRAKVGDFGLARVLEQHSEASLAKASSLGTPLYMAPELYEGKVSRHTDQYSLAVTYVELRTGKPPFHGDSIAAVMRAHLQGRPDLSLLSSPERKVLEKGLAKKTTERFENCTEFARALENALHPRSSSWRNRIAVGIAAISVPLLVFVIWFLFFRFDVTVPSRVLVEAGGEADFGVAVTTPALLKHPSFRIADPSDDRLSFDWEFDGHMLRVRTRVASLNESPGEVPVELVAQVGTRKAIRTILVQVEPPVVEVPPGFTSKPGAQLVRCRERILYEEIVKTLPNQIEVGFRLICSEDPPSFYILKTKVWNSLFAQFAQEHPDQLDPNSVWRSETNSIANPQFPAFHVSVMEAHRFALWLGGKLPSQKQWDKAAGRFDRPEREAEGPAGPYLPTWQPTDVDGIAINRKDSPLPVGSASCDVSPLGISDMAGNGFEWTRDVGTAEGATKDLDDVDPRTARMAAVYVRGMDYHRATPLAFRELDDPSYPVNPLGSYGPDGGFFSDDTTSFRVVVDLPQNP